MPKDIPLVATKGDEIATDIDLDALADICLETGLAALKGTSGAAYDALVYTGAIVLTHLKHYNSLAEAADFVRQKITPGEALEKFNAAPRPTNTKEQKKLMDKPHRDTITKMEKSAVDPKYIIGWEGGYLGHPARESQRVTDAYKAGYEDGKNKATDNFKPWAKAVFPTQHLLPQITQQTAHSKTRLACIKVAVSIVGSARIQQRGKFLLAIPFATNLDMAIMH